MMGSEGIATTRAAPAPLTFALAINGIQSSRSVVETRIEGNRVLLVDSEEPGCVDLQVGPVPPDDFTYPKRGNEVVALDATACRHLARLLDAKAEELCRHQAADQKDGVVSGERPAA